MVFKNLCILVLWVKVASALEAKQMKSGNAYQEIFLKGGGGGVFKSLKIM